MENQFCPINCGATACNHATPPLHKEREEMTQADDYIPTKNQKEENWEERFNKEYGDYCNQAINGMDKDIKSFIRTETQKAYWQGIKVMEEECDRVLESQRKDLREWAEGRIRKILEGVEGDVVKKAMENYRNGYMADGKLSGYCDLLDSDLLKNERTN